MSDIPSIKTLKSIKDIKQENKAAIYDIVLGRCSEKIIDTNKQTDNTHLVFELPKVIIGYPNYNQNDCGEYIVKKLIEKGYSSKLLNSNFLYIDWSDCVKDSKHGQKISSNLTVPCRTVEGSGTLMSGSNSIIKDSTLKETKNLLKKYPDTSEVVFIYKDTNGKKKKRIKKKK